MQINNATRKLLTTIKDGSNRLTATITSAIGGYTDTMNDFGIHLTTLRVNKVLDLYANKVPELVNPRIEIINSQLFLCFTTKKVFVIDVRVRLDVRATLNPDQKTIIFNLLGFPVITSAGYFKNKVVRLYTAIAYYIFKSNPIYAKLKELNLGGITITGDTIQLDLDDPLVDAALGSYKHAKQLLKVVSISAIECVESELIVWLRPFPKKGQTVSF